MFPWRDAWRAERADSTREQRENARKEFGQGTCSVGSRCEAVSYTHLDVYKRQVQGNCVNHPLWDIEIEKLSEKTKEEYNE